MNVSYVTFSDILANRLDVAFYHNRFNFTSNVYSSFCLSELFYINPTVKYENLSDNDIISFVPMEVVDEQNGVIAERRSTTVSQTKGFTKFKENDLIWAKITPCMQNGKSAIAKNLINGYGCGSTEFYVLRPKNDNVLIEYIHFILRDRRILESAKNGFSGVAGQQRVSLSYLKSIQVPLPPKEIQQQIVDLYNNAVREKQAKEQEAKALLDSIDDYLLKELGIEMPENVSNERYFKVNVMDLIGRRLDPISYNAKSKSLQKMITNSSLLKTPLKEMIIQSVSGDWGIDETEIVDESYTKCLVIRSTEFDSQYNLNLDNSRIKYRNIKTDKLKKIDVQPNDLLIEKSGGSPDQPVGRIAVLTKDIVENFNKLCYSNFIHKIRVDNSKVIPEFVYFYLKTLYNIGFTESIQSQTNGIRNLIMNEYFRQNILLPDKHKQQEIVNMIVSIQSKAKQLQQEATEVLEKAQKIIEKIIINE
jgi:type I restriction enzyme S subunit